MLQCVYSRKQVIRFITIDFGEFVLLLEDGNGLAMSFPFHCTALSVGVKGRSISQKPKGGMR